MRKRHRQTKALAAKVWEAVFPSQAWVNREEREQALHTRAKAKQLRSRVEARTNHDLDYFDNRADKFFDRRIKTFGWNHPEPSIRHITTLGKDLHLELWLRGELNAARRWLSGEITRLITKRKKSPEECNLLKVRQAQLQQVRDALIDYRYLHERLKNVKRRRFQGSTILKRRQTRERNAKRKGEIQTALYRSRLAIGKEAEPPIIRRPGESAYETWYRHLEEAGES